MKSFPKSRCSGGCFINCILLERISSKLSAIGLDIYVQEQVSTGDGGIFWGQAVIAAANIQETAWIFSNRQKYHCRDIFLL